MISMRLFLLSFLLLSAVSFGQFGTAPKVKTFSDSGGVVENGGKVHTSPATIYWSGGYLHPEMKALGPPSGPWIEAVQNFYDADGNLHSSLPIGSGSSSWTCFWSPFENPSTHVVSSKVEVRIFYRLAEDDEYTPIRGVTVTYEVVQ